MEIVEVPVKRIDIKKGEETELKEWVVSEKKYLILINETEIALISASPYMMKELTVGYVVGGGFVHLEDITDIEVGAHTVKVTTERPVDGILKHVRSSDCSSHWVSEMVAKEGIVKSALRVPAKVIVNAVSRLQSDTETWKKTHAVHSAGLFTQDAVIGLVEDVSRHNAFDKVVGKALLEGCDFSRVFAAVSGRITQDMVVKAGNLGIPLVASRSTVIEPAVTVASALGVTVIGYVRGGHLVIFAHPERVVVKE